jgi:hypothetical protein
MQEIDRQKNDNVQPISFSNLLWLFFDAILRFVKHTIRFFYSNWIFLMIFFAAGIVSGVIISKLSKPVYSTTILVKYTELNANTFGRMLDDLDKLSSTGSSAELAKSLNISEKYSREFVSFSGRNMQGIDLSRDTSTLNSGTFLIELEIRNNRNIDTLEYALLNYFNNNSFLKKLKDDQIELKKVRLLFLNSELQKLDSLKKEYNAFLSSEKGSTFYNNAFNPVDIYKQSSEYYDEKTSLEEWLRQSKESILKIDKAKPTEVPQSMNLTKYALLFGLIFFLVGCLFAAFKSVITAS